MHNEKEQRQAPHTCSFPTGESQVCWQEKKHSDKVTRLQHRAKTVLTHEFPICVRTGPSSLMPPVYLISKVGKGGAPWELYPFWRLKGPLPHLFPKGHHRSGGAPKSYQSRVCCDLDLLWTPESIPFSTDTFADISVSLMSENGS